MELVATLNSLIGASKRGKDEIFKVVDFLTGYTTMHLATEEELQIQYNYPNYRTHKKSHDEFKAAVCELEKRLIDEGPTADMLDLVTTTIGNWLINHIKGDDLHMASFVKSKDVS